MSEEITFIQIIADNFQNILTVVSSISGAVMGSLITAKASQRNDIKKTIHAKRVDSYFEFYEIVEKLLNNRSYVFDDEYFQSIISCKARIKLMASTKTYNAFEKFYCFVREYNFEYHEYCNARDPYRDSSKFAEVEDENGDSYPECYVTTEDEEYFEIVKKRYISDNTPNLNNVRTYINPLYEAMRSDLGSAL